MNKDYHIYFHQYKLELFIDHGSLLTALTPTIMSCPALSVLQQMSPHSPQPQTHITSRRGLSTPIFLVPLYRQKNAPITHWLGIPVGGFLQPGGGLHPPNPKCRMSLGTAKECSIQRRMNTKSTQGFRVVRAAGA